MGATTAVSLRAVASAITGWVVAVLILVAALIGAIGLVRAWFARRRPQVVINNVELDQGVPAEAAAGLSPQLREKVRRELRQQTGDATHAQMETLEEDIAAGLVTVRGGVVRMTAIEELDRTTSDSMAALSAGLRAVGPNAAEGLAVALDLALPAQRGWSVSAFPTIRGRDGEAQVGLTVEVARIGRAPDAVTTFWRSSDALQRSASDAARLAAMNDLLHQLLRPASVWIAIQLVARHLAQTRGRSHGMPSIRGSGSELNGLQLQLAGQMSLYATRAQKNSAEGFFDQALKDLDRAAELLPQYYRPPLTQAAIYERRGWSYRQSGEHARAHSAFRRAVDAFDEAERLLQACGPGADPSKRDAAIERLNVRRTKCRLLSSDPAHVVRARPELERYTRLRDARPVQLYNAACLFAVAVASPHLADEERELSEWRAWLYLGRALVLGGPGSAPWSRMATDEELDALDVDRRMEFRKEFQRRHDDHGPLTEDQADPIVEGAMLALGLTNPIRPDLGTGQLQVQVRVDDVRPSCWRGPAECAGDRLGEGPAGVLFEYVVSPAAAAHVAGAGKPALVVGDSVVEVALLGGAAAAPEPASAVADGDEVGDPRRRPVGGGGEVVGAAAGLLVATGTLTSLFGGPGGGGERAVHDGGQPGAWRCWLS
jgi:tetratricopeptide (TPR) repeat protein